jgi:replicative DNA helicase
MPEPVNVELSLPVNQHAEMTILGGCLVDAAALADSLDLLSPDAFALDSHREIFSAIQAINKTGASVDIVTVTDYLQKNKRLAAVGGLPYIASLSEGLPRKLSVESYVRIVHDAYLQRQLYTFGTSVAEGVLAKEDEAMILIGKAKRWLASIEDETGADTPMESVGQYLADTYADPEDVFILDPQEQGTPSGFAWQDDKTGGYVPGRLYILAARPSMGKTAKVVNEISNVALKAKVPTAVFTFEQDRKELLQRLLCGRATANLTDFIKGRSDHGDKAAILKAYQDYQQAPLYWDHSPGLTVTQIRAKLIRLQKSLTEKLKVVFIDQLSFMKWDDVYEKGQRTDQLIGSMTRGLKRMGQELGVAVVLVCQLGRSATKNKDARPTLADLKESGSIEENADVVAFLHRAEYYDRTDPSLRGKGEYIIAKQRQGPVGSHVLKYMAQSVKWLDEWTPKDGDDDGEQIPW